MGMGAGLCVEQFMNRLVATEEGAADGCTVQMDGCNGGGSDWDELTKGKGAGGCVCKGCVVCKWYVHLGAIAKRP